MYDVRQNSYPALIPFGQSVSTTFAFRYDDACSNSHVFTIPPKPAPPNCCYRRGNLVPTASHKEITLHACVGRLIWWNRRLTRVVECCHNTLVNSYIERLRVAPRINANGPLVWAVSVTRHSHPGTYPGCWQKIVPVARRVWRVFLPSGYKFSWALRVSRYKVDKWPVSCLGCRKSINVHWRSIAVQVVSEPVICHGARF